MPVTIENPEIEPLLKIAVKRRAKADRPFIDVMATLPKGDLRHLAEKIRMPTSWWDAARIKSDSFRNDFSIENSFFFVCCDGFLQGFWYIESFWYDNYDRKRLYFPDEWLCIEPIEMKGFQNVRTAYFPCIAKSRKESMKIVDEWANGKRLNPRTGRWEVTTNYSIMPKRYRQG